MSQFFQIHPENPQKRLIQRAVDMLQDGAVIVYPTDSSYALGCTMNNKQAMERILRIRQVDSSHHLTLVCRDLSEISIYARVDNQAYRFLRSHTPGPFTFLLKATKEVPKRTQNPKRKSIGIRVPDHPITLELLETLGEPMLSSTMILPGETMPMVDAEEIRDVLQQQVDLVIDGGHCGFEPTTVIDMIDGTPQIKRQGMGEVEL